MEKEEVVMTENFVFKVVDEGDKCNVLIRKVQSQDEANQLVQALTKLMVAASDLLTGTPYFCGHMACIFNGIGQEAVAELRAQFPEAYRQAREQAFVVAEQEHAFRNKERKDDEPLH